jgi:hypothetical protein
MSESTLLERLMPQYDAARIERRVLMASPTPVWDAVLRADFVRTAEEVPAVRFLFGARTAAERAVAAVRRRPAPPAPEVESMRLADLPSRGEWVLLKQDPPHQIVFGAIGRFWGGETAWEEIGAAEFAAFDRPGFAKVGCSFHVWPCGDLSTLVTYECRTLATDPSARRAFMRYWRPLSPFIGVVLRAQLRVIESTLEEAPRNA